MALILDKIDNETLNVLLLTLHCAFHASNEDGCDIDKMKTFSQDSFRND